MVVAVLSSGNKLCPSTDTQTLSPFCTRYHIKITFVISRKAQILLIPTILFSNGIKG